MAYLFCLVLKELGAIAQLGERYTGSVEVSGSIPLGSTILEIRSERLESICSCFEEMEEIESCHGRLCVMSYFLSLKKS